MKHLLIIVALEAGALLQGADAALGATCSRLLASETKSTVERFKFRPAGLLDQFVSGEPALSATISMVVSTDPSGTQALTIDLLRTANLFQKRAIGRGLGLAALRCQQEGQTDVARRLEEALRQRNEPEAIAAFNLAYLAPALPGQSTVDRLGVPTGGRLMGQLPVADPQTSVFRSQELQNPNRPLRLVR